MRTFDALGEWGRSVKEISLLEFQQWIGKRIPPEDEEGLSQTKEAIKKRKYRAKKKQEYESLLREMRARAKGK
jgi:hypothetical protein